MPVLVPLALRNLLERRHAAVLGLVWIAGRACTSSATARREKRLPALLRRRRASCCHRAAVGVVCVWRD